MSVAGDGCTSLLIISKGRPRNAVPTCSKIQLPRQPRASAERSRRRWTGSWRTSSRSNARREAWRAQALRHCRLTPLLIPSAPMKPAAKFRAMNDRRRPALPVVLLAVAQILLPSIAVVHAHSPEAVGFRGHAVDRPTVHAHGAGLAHEHSPGPAEDDRAKTGFRRLGVPTATLHDSTANWISSWKEAAAPPGMSESGTPRGAARLGTLVFSCNPRAPDHFLGLSLEPESAARPSGWIAGTRPPRGPPSSA